MGNNFHAEMYQDSTYSQCETVMWKQLCNVICSIFTVLLALSYSEKLLRTIYGCLAVNFFFIWGTIKKFRNRGCCMCTKNITHTNSALCASSIWILRENKLSALEAVLQMFCDHWQVNICDFTMELKLEHKPKSIFLSVSCQDDPTFMWRITTGDESWWVCDDKHDKKQQLLFHSSGKPTAS